ncbi:MAG TPA: hypothetical protein VNM14_00790 [Planctomycetota bacterium]|nr:hypothetical protein [Planctomycetota bacterium]
MTPFDETAVFVKVDKLRDRMSRLGSHTNPEEWQQTRLLIRALAESVAKLQRPAATSRKVSLDAPDALSADWDELVDVLMKKGVKAEK